MQYMAPDTRFLFPSFSFFFFFFLAQIVKSAFAFSNMILAQHMFMYLVAGIQRRPGTAYRNGSEVDQFCIF
jgi:hypothetical protein